MSEEQDNRPVLAEITPDHEAYNTIDKMGGRVHAHKRVIIDAERQLMRSNSAMWQVIHAEFPDLDEDANLEMCIVNDENGGKPTFQIKKANPDDDDDIPEPIRELQNKLREMFGDSVKIEMGRPGDNKPGI